MIYLIQSKSIDIDKNKIVNLLKIGYTEDSCSSGRFTAYRMHNPLCKILYTISGGTEIHEKSLHYKFRYFLYPEYGREWFMFDNSIIDFFKNNNTIDDLDNSLRINKNSISDKEYKEISHTIKFLVDRWLNLTSDKDNTIENSKKIRPIIEECRKEIRHFIKTKEDVLVYLSTKYNISQELQDTLQNHLNGKIDNTERVSQFLSEFNNDCKDNYERMRMLCEYELTDNELSVVLDQIPIQFKNYYLTLGKEKCKALSYHVTKMDRAISDLQFDVSKLRDEIYKFFKLNERYTKASIKQALSSLYSSLGYNKTPKANDLEEYFNLKLVDIPNKETGKKDKGFLILSKKED